MSNTNSILTHSRHLQTKADMVRGKFLPVLCGWCQQCRTAVYCVLVQDCLCFCMC